MTEQTIKIPLEDLLRLIKNGKKMPRKLEEAERIEVVVSTTKTFLLGSFIERDEKDTQGGFGLCENDDSKSVWHFRCSEEGIFSVSHRDLERIYFSGTYRAIDKVISAVQKAV